MKFGYVVLSIGKFLQLLALSLLVPWLIGLHECSPFSASAFLDPRVVGFEIAIALAYLTGQTLTIAFRRSRDEQISVREGFAIVTFGWIVVSIVGAVPLTVYFQSQQHFAPQTLLRSFTDAYFEIMSGFTTTGATILTSIESMPHGLLFWRSLTHWLGGMGIVTLALAIFPTFGVSAYQLFRGEVPGPTKERLSPRLAQTALVLWGVYALFTFVEVVLLRFGGMTLLDAFCHAFGTMATGGFSTRDLSIAAYPNGFIHWVIIVFMLLAGTNFILVYRAIFLRDPGIFGRDHEFRFYISVLGAAIVVCSIILWIGKIEAPSGIQQHFRGHSFSSEQAMERFAAEENRIAHPYHAIRNATFQVVSIMTTTGYVTADFDIWPTAIKTILVVLMFFGASAGSTAGGMKAIRIMVVLKAAVREIRLLVQPRLIHPVKIGKESVEERQVSHIVSFFVLFVGIFALMTILVSLTIPDFTTAVTAVAATLGNIGPGLAGVGAFENYAWIPIAGKWLLATCMLLGRLEIYTVLVAFSPYAWKR